MRSKFHVEFSYNPTTKTATPIVRKETSFETKERGKEWVSVRCKNFSVCKNIIRMQQWRLDKAAREEKNGPYCWTCRMDSGRGGYSSEEFT